MIHILYIYSFGQHFYSLKGQVFDEKNQPVAGANIMLLPISKGAVTDNEGRFLIHGITKGRYTIRISYVGYLTVNDTITITGNTSYSVNLKTFVLSLQEVIVADNQMEKRKKEETLNLEIVNAEFLKQNLGGSLLKTLERLPGVSTIDIGTGQSKPVIRGLGFNSVVVIENGIRHEAQQWGSDHGLEIDQYSVDYIEVIKGPVSLIYGSDAIGGVIDIKKKFFPPDNSIGGQIDITGKTNNDFAGSSVSLYARKKSFFADLRVSFLSYGDYRVPADSVDIYSYRAALYRNFMRNTAGNENNYHLTFGYIAKKFETRLFISNVNGKTGFFANAHGLEPRQVDWVLHDKSNRDLNYPYHEFNHFKIISNSKYFRDRLKIESDLGFQKNLRQEWSQYVSHGFMPSVFPDSMSFDPDLELLFDKNVYSENLKFSFDKNNKAHFYFGLNADFQDNRIDGRGFIIPAFKQLNLGIFTVTKFNFTQTSILQAGIRYDFGQIRTVKYHDCFVSQVIINQDTTYQYLKRADAINRKFSNISWSVGYNYSSKNWIFKANIGKSFRMPIAKELAANGVNYHHFSYEVGDDKLLPEICYQLDVCFELSSSQMAIGITPFVSYFSNYIYLNPSPEHDRLYGNGNQIYYYTQSKVFRYGTEIHLHYQLVKSLQFGLIGEYAYSEQLSGEKKGFTLPFSPPFSAILNLKYQKEKIGFMNNAYFSVDYRLSAPQNLIVPPEEPTDGFQIINLGLGSEVRLRQQIVNISLQVQNLLNTKYFSHTSYYRLINVPEPGRNFILNISFHFSGKIKE